MPKLVKVEKPVWGSKLKLSADCPSVSTYESRFHILLACGCSWDLINSFNQKKTPCWKVSSLYLDCINTPKRAIPYIFHPLISSSVKYEWLQVGILGLWLPRRGITIDHKCAFTRFLGAFDSQPSTATYSIWRSDMSSCDIFHGSFIPWQRLPQKSWFRQSLVKLNKKPYVPSLSFTLSHNKSWSLCQLSS